MGFLAGLIFGFMGGIAVAYLFKEQVEHTIDSAVEMIIANYNKRKEKKEQDKYNDSL